MIFRFEVKPSEKGSKLLQYLRDQNLDVPSVKFLKKAIDNGLCKVNSKIERFSTRPLKPGDRIELNLTNLERLEKTSTDEISVLFEDEYLLICDKPAGIVSEDKLFNKRFSAYRNKLKLIHRLDKETSGVILLSKTAEMWHQMVELFESKGVFKVYLAVVDGAVKEDKGRIETLLTKKSFYQGQTIYGSAEEGNLAITNWKCLARGQEASLIQCEPVTGRTHQLRVHLSEMGHPILGDDQYGKFFSCSYRPPRHLLHAYQISFEHPLHKKRIEATAPIPNDFRLSLESLKVTPRASFY